MNIDHCPSVLLINHQSCLGKNPTDCFTAKKRITCFVLFHHDPSWWWFHPPGLLPGHGTAGGDCEDQRRVPASPAGSDWRAAKEIGGGHEFHLHQQPGWVGKSEVGGTRNGKR